MSAPPQYASPPQRIELTFAQCPGVAFRIARRLAEAVARESGGRLRLPPST